MSWMMMRTTPTSRDIGRFFWLLAGIAAGMLATTYLRAWWPEPPSVEAIPSLLLSVGVQIPERIVELVDAGIAVIWPYTVMLVGGAVAAVVTAMPGPKSGAAIGAWTGGIGVGATALLLVVAAFAGHLTFPLNLWGKRLVVDPVFSILFGVLGGMFAGVFLRGVGTVASRARSSI